uniref:Asparagine--tRNA ligase, cytoplasmic n=1 Tax=Lygus hesperus TaxID=30085 RepID=A0A0A9X4V8_LYGHE
MLVNLENVICTVFETTVKRAGEFVALLNPEQLINSDGDLRDPHNYKFCPHKPFRRLRYADAIKFCNEHNIINSETNAPFVFGDDITEKPEREMVAMMNEFVFMTHFPAAMKSFYMQRDPEDNTLTESVDVLAPGVGEIVGGSMRMWKVDELKTAFEKKGIDPAAYY